MVDPGGVQDQPQTADADPSFAAVGPDVGAGADARGGPSRLNGTGAGLAQVGSDLTVHQCTPAFAAVWNNTADALVGLPLSDLPLPEDVVAAARRVLESRTSAHLEATVSPLCPTHGARGRRLDVALEPWDIGPTPSEAAPQGPGVLILLFETAVESDTGPSGDKPDTDYRLIAENQSALVVKVGADHRFHYVNPAYCRLFGRTRDELIGRTFMPMVHEDDRDSTLAALESLNRPPHIAYLEQRAWTVRGWRWLSWQNTAVVDDTGHVLSVIGVGHDITERRVAREEQQRNLANLRAFFNLSQDLLVVLNPRGRILETNTAVTSRLGWSRADLVGRSVFRLLSRWPRVVPRRRMRAILSGAGHGEQFMLVTRDGETVLVESRMVEGSWNGAPALFTSSRDLSELALMREKFERVFLDNATMMVISEPRSGRILDVNGSFLRALNLDREDVLGRTSVDLGLFASDEARLQILGDAITGRHSSPTEVGVRLPDGGHAVVQWSTATISSGGTDYLLTMLTDVTQQQELMAQLEYRANHDGLTGALTRQKGTADLEKETQRAQRQKHPTTIVLLDIDNFKAINDQLGHVTGDRILVEVVARLSERVRQTDSLVRWGGEEFLVILPDTDATGGGQLAEALRAAVERVAVAGGDRVTISLGVATWRPGESLEEWVNRADAAMYQAKRAGRNRVVLAPD
ncbi:sensor domain-containing diguanylate cyclase [Roseospira marina]|uniref:sensor domain-containing diguanylate cyclase n=1 Tax=Roseospira marina TaxID=140057 RepID=UPI001479532A|nr:diguanylate cyclase [Roseospira marina]MBB4314635.1 diguanylate cyclase (GGDEF)-like protein/PAS domain S-box-containing protein [Roseospira marina]MBB5088760.1 diguanylate cyclase (GGDEF)-like protein/PAS domain S-box-containing protein [Roseospira marina]